eukprot:TRINITY_DN12653_c0_g1_i3.p1 TRINITY_DN12653_c0_g1~~TRINITY_DN12653_c0_g1_i3.p1  ORF type:complete len:196 (-),score=41.15 TRINITY_DN12653_c0_g1_i3:133-720(-)
MCIRDSTGLPKSHVESGYLSVYEPGFEMNSLHLDNHHQGMQPKRSVSAVIYLTDVPTSGQTVFPLVNASFAPLTHQEQQERHEIVDWWRQIVNSSEAHLLRPNDGPQALRGVSKGRLFTEAQRMCRAAQVPAAARAGTALLFHSLTEDGHEDLRAMHGSCSVSSGSERKVVLAKFIRTGPKPHFLIQDGRRVLAN